MKTRTERVAHELQRELAGIIRDEVKDPRIGFITITRVLLTDDLQEARVWFSCLGSATERAASLAGLRRAEGFVRKAVAQRMELRLVPRITFQYDDSLTTGNDVLKTLDALKASQSSPARQRPADA